MAVDSVIERMSEIPQEKLDMLVSKLATSLDHWVSKEEKWGMPIKDIIYISIYNNDLTKIVKVSSNHSNYTKNSSLKFLKSIMTCLLSLMRIYRVSLTISLTSKSLRTIKKMQSLAGQIVALSHLISKATDRCKPFFQSFERGQEVPKDHRV